MDELMICVAPYPSEKQTARVDRRVNVPEEVLRSYHAGASIAHLHVRDEEGKQVADPVFFQSNVEEIHRSCPIIIEGSTGGGPEHTLHERSTSFRVPGIEMGSLNVGSINMYDGVYQNSMPDIRYYAQELRKRSIKPFICIFDLSMLYNVEELAKEGLISSPFVYNFVFDTPGCLPFSEKALGFFLNHIPNNSPWFMTRHHAKGWKDFQMALERGGHVRVGYEDSPFLSSGAMAQSNANLVEEIAKAAPSFGRKVVHSDRAREILGIPPRK